MALFSRFTDSNQWVQVDFGHPERIAGVVTQGHPNLPQWVESFVLATSLDGTNWYQYTDQNARISPTKFAGNFDQATSVRSFFDREIDARYVRVYPKSWHGGIAVRLEVLSCYGPAPLLTSGAPNIGGQSTPTAVPPINPTETPTAAPGMLHLIKIIKLVWI